MHDRFRSKYRVPTASTRRRQQIGREARVACSLRSFSMARSQHPAGSTPSVTTSIIRPNEERPPFWDTHPARRTPIRWRGPRAPGRTLATFENPSVIAATMPEPNQRHVLAGHAPGPVRGL